MVLDKKDSDAVKEIFEPMKKEVELLFFTSKDCQYCSAERDLLKELSGLGKITVSEHEIGSEESKKLGIDMAPALTFKSNTHIKFLGIPSGHEFRTLLDTIVMISTEKTELNNEIKEGLARVNAPVDLKVFVTPTCPYCPTAVLTAHQFAMENKNIHSTMIEATEFQELSKKHGVMSVPKIVINDDKSFEGAVPAHVFLKKVSEEL